MDTRSKLVAALLLAFSGWGFAGYALPSPPAGHTAAPSGGWQYQAAANDSVVSKVVRLPGPIVNVGGRAVQIPAALRLAANAATYAARGIHPLIIAGIVLAPIVYTWIEGGGFKVENGQLKKTDPTVCTVGPCFLYASVNLDFGGQGPFIYSSAQDAANASLASASSIARHRVFLSWIDALTFRWSGDDCPSGCNGPVRSQSTAPSSPVWVPVTPQEFETGMAPRDIPDALPKALPFPLPVDPLPWLNPTPGNNPLSQPMRMPLGSPVPIPNSSPQQYRNPVIDIVPAPTPASPWRVDLVPKDVISESPLPLPETAPVTEPNPGAEIQKEPDLCEKNPDILACKKVGLGEVTPEAVKNMDRTMAINKDTGWGPENGTCPAPKTAVVLGVSLSMPFTLICELAVAIRPLVIGMAWLSAALTFFGLGRKE